MEENVVRVDRRKFLGFGAAAVATITGAVVINRTGVAQDSGTPEASPAASPDASPAASPVAGAGEFTVTAIELAFEPKEFTIPAGTDVVVTIENGGALQHDFVIDELEVKSDLLDGGSSGTVTINAEPGTYEFYCSVPGHAEAGMVGTLTVQ